MSPQLELTPAQQAVVDEAARSDADAKKEQAAKKVDQLKKEKDDTMRRTRAKAIKQLQKEAGDKVWTDGSFHCIFVQSVFNLEYL
jgi:hypothetical protein